MIVVVTEAAERDLEAIGDFIAQDSPERAATFVLELYDACKTIVDAPLGYSFVPRYEDFGVRRRVYGNYLIFYRIAGEVVEVLHILHGARDYESILFTDG